MRFPAIPARYLRAHRLLARIAAVARQRASAARVIGAPVEPCLAPPFGANVLLAGEPRLEAKLHRSWPGGLSPARAVFSLQMTLPGTREVNSTVLSFLDLPPATRFHPSSQSIRQRINLNKPLAFLTT